MGFRIIERHPPQRRKTPDQDRSELLLEEARRYSLIRGTDPDKTKAEFLAKINSIKKISEGHAKSQAEHIETLIRTCQVQTVLNQNRLGPSLITDLL